MESGSQSGTNAVNGIWHMESHMLKQHENKKPLKCDNCDFVSIRRTSIEKHTNTKHQVCITEITKKKIYEK